MTSFRPILALRMAARGLRRDASTTSLAVGILAIGLALPTVFFSLLVGSIRPLPVPDGQDIVRLDVRLPSAGGRLLPVTAEDIEGMAGASGLVGLGGFASFAGVLVDPERAAARVSGAVLSPGVLPLLQVGPALGRVPTASESTTAVLLGWDLFDEMYDADASALGRSVLVDGAARTVVGVMPEGFGFPFNQNLWVVMDEAVSREPLELVGRLAEGVRLPALEAELTGRWQRRDGLRQPGEAGGVVDVEPYTGSRGEGGETVAFVGLVLVAVALLLIACANVANLLLVRATERVRALGIQSALGASRSQVGGQLLFEALLVAVAGGVFGVGLAWYGVEAIQRGLAGHFGYYWMRMAMDGRVVSFSAFLVLGTALVAGTLPIVRILRVDVLRVLKEEGAAAAVGGGGAWSRAFVTVQLALSCAALVAAGLTGRSMLRGGDFGSGVPGAEVLLGGVDLSVSERPRHVLLDELGAALAALPGVDGAAVALGVAGYMEPSAVLEVEGVPYPRSDDRSYGMWNAISPSYLDLLDLEVISGRGFDLQDNATGLPVALVSRDFVRRQLADGEALGRRVRLVHSARDTTAWFTVVGVVEDAVLSSEANARHDRVYLPLAQVERDQVTALVRDAGGVRDVTEGAAGLRRAVAGVDPMIPVWGVRTLDDAHAYIVRIPRALAGIALGGGSAGMLVAAVGLYGLLAFRVRQRRRELGVRLALGADGRRLAGEIMRQALRQVVPALAVGLVLAWLAAPILQVMLLGGDPRSVSTFAGVAGTFLVVGLAAAVLPALRAAAVDPARTLRGE